MKNIPPPNKNSNSELCKHTECEYFLLSPFPASIGEIKWTKKQLSLKKPFHLTQYGLSYIEDNYQKNKIFFVLRSRIWSGGFGLKGFHIQSTKRSLRSRTQLRDSILPSYLGTSRFDREREGWTDCWLSVQTYELMETWICFFSNLMFYSSSFL